MPSFKVGDIIEITAVDDNKFYSVGDKAILHDQDQNGYFQANFTINDHFNQHGYWNINEPGTKYKLASSDAVSTKIDLGT